MFIFKKKVPVDKTKPSATPIRVPGHEARVEHVSQKLKDMFPTLLMKETHRDSN